MKYHQHVFLAPCTAGLLAPSEDIHAQDDAQQEPFKVVTTFTVLSDMASHVAANATEVVSVTMPGAEIYIDNIHDAFVEHDPDQQAMADHLWGYLQLSSEDFSAQELYL